MTVPPSETSDDNVFAHVAISGSGSGSMMVAQRLQSDDGGGAMMISATMSHLVSAPATQDDKLDTRHSGLENRS